MKQEYEIKFMELLDKINGSGILFNFSTNLLKYLYTLERDIESVSYSSLESFSLFVDELSKFKVLPFTVINDEGFVRLRFDIDDHYFIVITFYDDSYVKISILCPSKYANGNRNIVDTLYILDFLDNLNNYPLLKECIELKTKHEI